MSGDGYQTPASSGNGNGTAARVNAVSVSENYRNDCTELEEQYPRLRNENFFANLETYMIVCEVEDDAYHLGGSTWMIRTPEGLEPSLTIYFTYHKRHITLQEVAEI